ncbi:MAG: AMP-binding protein [Pseudomonadota bacterium]
MLETLNTFLRKPDVGPGDDHVLWCDLGGGPDVSLDQFRQEISALRTKLSASDAQRWLLYSDDPHYFLLGFLALLGLKKKIVISASLKPEWLHDLGDAFDAVLSDQTVVVPDLENGKTAEKSCFDFALPSQPDDNWQPQFDGAEEIVFFTSGSTGRPKAIEKNLLALTNEVTTLGTTFHAAISGGMFVASVSHLHIYGLLFKLLLPLLIKAPALRQQIDYPEQLLGLAEKFEDYGPKVFISSPTFLSRLDQKLPPVAMKAVFSSGGPLSFAAANASQQYFSVRPIEVYGSTETGGIGYRQQAEPTTAWLPFTGVSLTPTDDGIELTSPNMPGHPPYILDDHLEFLPDGKFLMKGRKDRIVKIAEKRISLTEIEKFIEAHAAVAQCVALPIYARRDVIACAIVLSDEGNTSLASLGQHKLIQNIKATMQSRFEPVTIPRLWRILTAIPVNSQSKIDHNQLLMEFTNTQELN